MAKKYSNDNLKNASDHLFYEIWMMNRLASILEGESNSLFVSKSTPYTHTAETAILINSTGIVKTSQEGLKEDDSWRVTNNALIEAFGVHVRSLLDFFYSEGQHDDVVATHFFSSSSIWENARPFKSAEDLEKIKSRVNKEIAHLTYTRQKVESKRWYFKEIQDDLNKIIEVFSSLVPKNLLGSRWK